MLILDSDRRKQLLVPFIMCSDNSSEAGMLYFSLNLLGKQSRSKTDPFDIWKYAVLSNSPAIQVSGSVTSQDRVWYLCSQHNTWPCSRTPDAQSLELDYWFCIPVTVFFLSKNFGRLLHSSQQMGYGSSQHRQLEARSEFARYTSKINPVLLPRFYIL